MDWIHSSEVSRGTKLWTEFTVARYLVAPNHGLKSLYQRVWWHQTMDWGPCTKVSGGTKPWTEVPVSTCLVAPNHGLKSLYQGVWWHQTMDWSPCTKVSGGTKPMDWSPCTKVSGGTKPWTEVPVPENYRSWRHDSNSPLRFFGSCERCSNLKIDMYIPLRHFSSLSFLFAGQLTETEISNHLIQGR